MEYLPRWHRIKTKFDCFLQILVKSMASKLLLSIFRWWLVQLDLCRQAELRLYCQQCWKQSVCIHKFAILHYSMIHRFPLQFLLSSRYHRLHHFIIAIQESYLDFPYLLHCLNTNSNRMWLILIGQLRRLRKRLSKGRNIHLLHCDRYKE